MFSGQSSPIIPQNILSQLPGADAEILCMLSVTDILPKPYFFRLRRTDSKMPMSSLVDT